jgi:hypothetical protein
MTESAELKETKYHIVFIHAGEASPRLCLSHSIEQALREALTSLVWLVTEARHWAKVSHELGEIALDSRLKVINLNDLPRQAEHEQFVRSRQFPGGPGGFWQVTTERFFILHDLMEAFSLEAVVHLESDVMIYGDVPAIIDSRRKGARLLYPLDRTRGIASVFFVAEAAVLGMFCRFANEHPSTHDMLLLDRFFKATSDSDAVASLPTIPQSVCKRHGLDEVRYSRPREEGWGLFDAAAIGQYLLGIDPRFDTALKLRFRNEESDLAGFLRDEGFIYTDDGLCLELESEFNVLRCIHVHSKRTAALKRLDTLKQVLHSKHSSNNSTTSLRFYHSDFERMDQSFIQCFDLKAYHQKNTTKVNPSLFNLLERVGSITCKSYLFKFLFFHILPYLDSRLDVYILDSEIFLDQPVTYSGLDKTSHSYYAQKIPYYKAGKPDLQNESDSFIKLSSDLITSKLINYLNASTPLQT